MTDQELLELQDRATRRQGVRARLSQLLGGPKNDWACWIPPLAREILRMRARCTQLEHDCAQLQREYDRLRYGSSEPAA